MLSYFITHRDNFFCGVLTIKTDVTSIILKMNHLFDTFTNSINKVKIRKYYNHITIATVSKNVLLISIE